MVHYCKAYFLRDLQLFTHWESKRAESSLSVLQESIYFLWDDFVVRQNPIHHEDVIFDAVTPEWLEFCKVELGFEKPSGMLKSSEAIPQTSPQLLSSETEGFQASDAIPFTSGQQWLVEELISAHPWYYNVLMIWPSLPISSFSHLLQIILYLTHYHDALRLRLVKKNKRWYQLLEDVHEHIPYTWICLSGLSETTQEKIIKDTALLIQHTLNKFQALLWHATYFESDVKGTGHLLWVINHFITDNFSNHILFEDFQMLHGQLLQGKALALPMHTTPFVQWTEKIAAYIKTSTAEKELNEYWLTLPWGRMQPFPLDFPEGRFFDEASQRYGYGTHSSSRVITVSLTTLETKTLFTRVLDTKKHILDVLLTAISYSIMEWKNSSIIYLFVQDHGRQTMFDDIDLSHTVGYIAHARRVVLDIDQAKTLEDVLSSVRQQLRQIPNQGRSFDWFLRRGDHLSLPDNLKGLPCADVHFNYHGRIGNQNPPLSFSLPVVQDPQTLRNHILSCAGGIRNQQLEFTWEYSCDIHYQATIDKISQMFISALRNLIAFRSLQ